VPLPVSVRLGALVDVPSVVPNVNVLAIFAAALNPPVPVQLNPVAIAKSRLTAAAVVVDNIILLLPKFIDLVTVLLARYEPIVRSYPPKSSVPQPWKKEEVSVNVCVPSKVSVPPSSMNTPRPRNILPY
jgi:hypothetical protein